MHSSLMFLLSMGFLSSLCSCFEKRLKRGGGDEADDKREESFDLFYELRALQIATNFFSDLNQLGHGGFGPVYKVHTAHPILILLSLREQVTIVHFYAKKLLEFHFVWHQLKLLPWNLSSSSINNLLFRAFLSGDNGSLVHTALKK